MQKIEVEKKLAIGEIIRFYKNQEQEFMQIKLTSKERKEVAIKMFRKEQETAQDIQVFANQTNILKKLNHPNIINLIEFQSPTSIQKKKWKNKKTSLYRT